MILPRNRPGPRATLADWLAIPEHERCHEIIDGELVRKAQPGQRHGYSQALLAGVLHPFQRRSGGPQGPGDGWWIVTEPDVLFDGEPLRPDVAGWRRARLPELSDAPFVELAPDWVCEILSPSNAANDTIKKKRIYHRGRVGHYWILDPREQSLTVYRWHADGYLELFAAQRGETVRAEPFEAIELAVGAFFGD